MFLHPDPQSLTSPTSEQVGIPALIVERGKELRSAGAGIRLQTNAWHALEQLGVAQRLREQHLRQTRCGVIAVSSDLAKHVLS